MPQVKLHRCPVTWAKLPGHACHRVEKALEKQGIGYERVLAPVSKSKREEVARLSGQRFLPVIEFEDGSVYREESKEMAATIRAGKLFEGRGASAAEAESQAQSQAQQQQ